MANTIETIISLKDEASAGFAKVSSSVEGVTSSLGKMVVGTVSIAAITSYLKGAVGEAIEAEEAFRHFSAQMEALSLSFDKSKIEAWADSMQRLAHIQDDTVIEALGRTVTKIGNLTTSMQLVQLAQDIVIAKGGSFEHVLNLLTLAAGPTARGMTMLTKEFGDQLRGVKSSSEALNILQGHFGGTAEKAHSLAIQLTDVTLKLKESKKSIGEELTPALQFTLTNAINPLIFGFMYFEKAAVAGMVDVIAGVNLLNSTMLSALIPTATNWQKLQVSWVAFKLSLKQGGAEVTKFYEDYKKAQIDALLPPGKINPPPGVEDLKRVQAHLQAQLELIRAYEGAQVSDVFNSEDEKIQAIMDSAHDQLVIEKQLVADKSMTQGEADDADIARQYQNMLKIVQIKQQGSQKWKKDLFDWGQSNIHISSQVVAVFTSAFDGIGNSFGSAMGGMLVQGKSFSRAFTHVWSDMAAQVISQISAMIAKWLAFKILTTAFGGGGSTGIFTKLFGMAEGGRVVSPTLAMIGEGGEPETVVPDSKAKAFASNVLGGNASTSITLNMGGITVNTGAGADTNSIINAIIFQIKNETINGVKLALASVNTAKRNAMRAV